ncbi:unnamed protein product [Acanthoscelides obtectus]|uniref:Uncharacterized protein n=1 Tax=Acanthoscelides obtectus TaxID=200917 RepID=A0A9P0Q5A4_ACAOB|nr:unnamed protein product [Acanthoscelides obtectus]CAK1682284.1 hypothetical protein AOBTE_LOCUS33532 [Acanthoscelides obtectus]
MAQSSRIDSTILTSPFIEDIRGHRSKRRSLGRKYRQDTAFPERRGPLYSLHPSIQRSEARRMKISALMSGWRSNRGSILPSLQGHPSRISVGTGRRGDR